MSTCPSCAQPIQQNAIECDACAVRIAYDAHGKPFAALPAIRPGSVLAIHDFGKVPLPGMTVRSKNWDDGDSIAATDQGILLTLLSGMRWFNQPYLRIRDSCVRACFDVYDNELRARVVVRKQSVDDASLWYELAVTPHDQHYRLARLFTAPEQSDNTNLSGPAAHQALLAKGTNVLELRAQGPTLEAWINGVKVCAVHDAALGIGGVAIGVGSFASGKKAQRALFRWLEVREVAP
ncbi:MAG TPA: hypothetical protein VGM44_03340 [Polyangiaceae bacterium]|jgi:hypothetical protein